MKKIFPFFVLILFFACSKGQTDEKNLPPRTKAKVLVEVYKAEIGTIRKTLSYYGIVASEREGLVYPDVPGRVIDFIKKEGEKVAKDVVIAYLERKIPGLKFEKYPVKAPIGGIIGKYYVNLGEMVAPQMPLALIYDPLSMVVDVEVPQSDLPYLKKGLKCDVFYGGRKFSGYLKELSPSVDPMKRTTRARVRIRGKDIPYGALAEVTFILEEKRDAIIIPLKAVVKENGEHYVFVAQNGIARKRKVKLGLVERGMVEILEGIKEGEEIVTLGARGLEDGQPIEVRRERG